MLLEEIITSEVIVGIDLKTENGAKYMAVSLSGELAHIITATKTLRDMKEKYQIEILVNASIDI